MATLREYFDTDFPSVLNAASTLSLTINQANSAATFDVRGRAHYDFDSGTKYLSYFIPAGPEAFALCEGVAMNPQWLFDAVKGVVVKTGYPGERALDAADLKFSGRVFLYTEELLSREQMDRVEKMAKDRGLDIVFRTPISAQERSRYEKPLAFISHDWRDKKDIAQPIALGLSKMRCPVWYDEYSVKVGDSLRASVEKGLKESKKCVLILSPNFLSNTGWTKTEFDSIFTRQILEGSNVVLPVWCGVTKQQVYEYSPSLLDRLAVRWDEGLDEVLRKLYRAIEPPLSNYTPLKDS
jgi:TIR domain